MRRFAVICMCAVAIAGAVPSVPAFAATGNVVMAAKSRTRQSQSGLQDTAQAVQIAFQNKDMEKLAGLCNFPLTIVYGDGSGLIFSSKMQDAIASTNAAKLQAEGNAGVQMGGDNGLNLYKFKKKWKVNSIYLDTAAGDGLAIKDIKEAAVTIQKTFSYKDMDTMAKLCNYPLTIVQENGNLKEIRNPQELVAMGEDKLFTEKLRDAIDRTDVDKLTTVGDAGVQMGGDSGLSMYRFNGVWKINNIYQ